MIRRFVSTFALVAAALVVGNASAGEPPPEPSPEAEGAEPDPDEAEPDADEAEPDADEAEPDAAPAPDPVDMGTPIRVIQQRPFLKSGRFELQVLGGLGINDSMFRHAMVVAQPRVHIDERWSIGGTYAHYFGEESSLLETVTTDFALFPERAETKFYAGLDVGFSVLEGKFLLFDDAIVTFDLYLTVGGGATHTSRSDTVKPTGMFGAGIRFVATRWLTVNFEVRDHLYVEQFNAGDELINNVVIQGGFGFFLPFDYDYRYAR